MIDYTCEIWWDTFDMGIPFSVTRMEFMERMDPHYNPWF